MAPSAGDVLAGLAAVCLVGAVAEAAPHMSSIDADVARLYRAAGNAGGLPMAGDRPSVLIETNDGAHFRLKFDGGRARAVSRRTRDRDRDPKRETNHKWQ